MDTVKSVFIVRWRWIDILDSHEFSDVYTGLEAAEAHAKRLQEDEERFGPTREGKGKLEIVIDRYNHDVECERRLV